MHYHAEVWIPQDGDIKEVEKQVSVAMSPYNEERVEEKDSVRTFWDWYQIGGRWTGSKDKYNPEHDSNNIITCRFCHGTGKRTDMEGQNGCNVCHGTGKELKWPTEWAIHHGDIIHVSDCPEELNCHTLLLAETEPIMIDKWNGLDIVKTDFDGNVKKELAYRGVSEGYLVTVDYHS